MVIKIRYKLNESSSEDDDNDNGYCGRNASFSQSGGTLEKSMRNRPRLWLSIAVILGVIFMSLLWIFMSWSTSAGNDKAWLHRYYSQNYGRVTPRDHTFDSLLPRVKAVILILCRNSDLDQMADTLKNFEKRFNKKYQYPYVFLNNEPFDDGFKQRIGHIIAAGSDAPVQFAQVPLEHWRYPSWIDQKKAEEVRRAMERRGVIYGGSESYRFMCRYYSGLFYKHPLLQQYEYYWRIEPGVRFTCDINYDVFRFMKNNGKLYGFVIAIQEIPETIPTLWKTVLQQFLPKHPRLNEKRDEPPLTIRYFGPPTEHGYNGCHFWSNFEIASFEFYRSSQYERYFETLDKAGGFFYERWGDAPVHSIAVGLFLKKEQVHYFGDLGYRHAPFSHCPADFVIRQDNNCDCDPFEISEASHGVCQTLWDVNYAL